MKGIISGIILTLLLLSMFALAFNIKSVKALSIIVPDDYPTIQEAINNANEGRTIFVRNGTYYQNIVVNKTISLIGQNKSSTYIYGNRGSVAVSIVADSVILSGFTVRSRGGAYDNSICISNVKDCNVSGDNVLNSFFGIEILSCSNCIIENDCTWNNIYGIGGGLCSNCSVSRNVAMGNKNGIAIDMSSSMVIEGNRLEGNHFAGFWSDYPESNNCIVNNSIMNNLYGIGLNYDNNDSVTGNCITGNTIVRNQVGIFLVSSPHMSVTRNQISQNSIGVELESSLEDNCITNNSIVNNTRYGIWLSSSSSNSIISNDISDKYYGLRMANSPRNTVYHNNFIDNTSQIYEQQSTNSWDNGYPSGGNYWSDCTSEDSHSGPYQNKTGSDGIGDKPYVIDANNKDNYPLMNLWAPPDVVVVNVTLPRNIVGQGCSLAINITVTNRGNKIESFNVTVYANTTAIGKQTIIPTSGNSMTITFTWNTGRFAYGNYTVSAYATPALREINAANNNFTGGTMKVTIPGDVDGDQHVTILDVAKITSIYGLKQGDPKFNPNCNIDGDGKITILDVVICTSHYAQKWP